MMVQAVPILVWVERRGSAFIQNRFGPNRVGPLGLVQLLADAVKFLHKEDFAPDKAINFCFMLLRVFALDSSNSGIHGDSNVSAIRFWEIYFSKSKVTK
jgi:NADH:ubiquinone oxidoreductase subunit H